MPSSPARSVVVVPAKPAAVAKSRLGSLSMAARTELAVAFATDTVTACLAAELVEAVVVVSEEPRLQRLHDDIRCVVVPDGRVPGLNPALLHGAEVAAGRWPGRRVVALLADLPALRASDLDAVLARDLADSWFVPDADGIGTTALSAPAESFDPRFGPQSARAHMLAGAHRVPDPPARLRRDVDDLPALDAAVMLGVGPATSSVLARRRQELADASSRSGERT